MKKVTAGELIKIFGDDICEDLEIKTVGGEWIGFHKYYDFDYKCYFVEADEEDAEYYTNGDSIWSIADVEELITLENCINFIKCEDFQNDFLYNMKEYAFRMLENFTINYEKAKEDFELQLKLFVKDDVCDFLEWVVENDI